MLFVSIKNMVISTENIQWIHFKTEGTGAKSNPFRFYIYVKYFNGEELTFGFDEKEKEEAEKNYEKISKILLEKA